MSTEKLVVLGTGGTIAGTASDPGDNVGYTAAQISVGALLRGVGEVPGFELVSEQVAQVDSKDMRHATWRQLALRCAYWLSQPDVRGIVITHGTDTLEETAFFLQAVLAPSKPVVLTCAMRPSTSPAPDGPQNLADALVVAATAGARGVVAVCAGRVHGAFEVAKVHPYRLDAFSSGEAGPVGVLEEGLLRRFRDWPSGAPCVDGRPAPEDLPAADWPRVEIVMNHAGADGAMVRLLCAAGVRGIVVAGTGNGTLAEPLLQALEEAVSQGVRVVRSTRCATGQVIPHAGDRLPDSGGLSPVKARIALMLALLAPLAPRA